MAGYPELVIGGVLFAPFVTYALAALAVLMVVKPLLRRLPLDAVFANPAVVMLCLYVQVLALLLLLF